MTRDEMHAAGGAIIAANLANKGVISSVDAQAVEKKLEKAPQQRGPRVVLNLKEDYDVTAWLHGRDPKYGETPIDILNEAHEALPAMAARLNLDHIKTRIAAFGDTLPKAKPPVVELTLYERVARLENLIAHFSHWILRGEGLQDGTTGNDDIRDFLYKTGL